MMSRLHAAHEASERYPAAQCSAAKEHLAKSYGEVYSIYLIGWEAVSAYGR